MSLVQVGEGEEQIEQANVDVKPKKHPIEVIQMDVSFLNDRQCRMVILMTFRRQTVLKENPKCLNQNESGIEEKRLLMWTDMIEGMDMGKTVNASMMNTTIGIRITNREWKLGCESVHG
jgi:hypothetical protein